MINIYNLIGFAYLDYFNDRYKLFYLWSTETNLAKNH